MPKKVIFHYEKNGQLSCDECGYKTEEKFPLSMELVNTRCPVCDAKWFTASDYKVAKRIYTMLDIFNFLFGWAFGVRKTDIDKHVATKLTLNTRK